jgi:hypothetical protein
MLISGIFSDVGCAIIDYVSHKKTIDSLFGQVKIEKGVLSFEVRSQDRKF